MKKTYIWYLAAALIVSFFAGYGIRGINMGQTDSNETAEISEETVTAIPYWAEDSKAMKSILDYVQSVTDPASADYVETEKRIAVFDFDGTLYGELFPTYFDTSLFIHRALHDETCTPPDEIREYARALEDAFSRREPEPDSDLSTAQCTAELFKDMSFGDYRAYIRDFMKQEVSGFNGMTYAEGFYMPMCALAEYLADNEFTVFISSGSERTMVRELIAGKLDQWIPSDNIIGSTFTLKASGQGEKAGKSYSYKADDEVLMEGNLSVKNQKTNKVFSIAEEIGASPLLVFGNSSGDLAMAQYALQSEGRGYMLLCDDTERDYGDPEKAASFAADCEAMGLETVSMKDDFATIYKEGFEKSDEQ